MRKWLDRAAAIAAQTRRALQLVYDSLNPGQRQVLLKNMEVKALFDRCGIEVSGHDG